MTTQLITEVMILPTGMDLDHIKRRSFAVTVRQQLRGDG